MQVVHKDEIVEIRNKNKLVGYIDEDQSLFGIDMEGYARLVETNINENKALEKIRAWKRKASC